MRKTIPMLILSTLVAGAMPQMAEAKGCIRGAVAGGIAGHYAHHHAVMGAVGGCVLARHYYNKKAERQRAEAAAHRGH